MKDLMQEKEFNKLEMQLVEAQKKLDELGVTFEMMLKINEEITKVLSTAPYVISARTEVDGKV